MAYNSLYEWQEIEALELGNKKNRRAPKRNKQYQYSNDKIFSIG
jgi:hypothetical protein